MKKARQRRLSSKGWQDAMARFAESGLTATAFCEREGISSNSFNRWRSRLGGPADQPVARQDADEMNPPAGFIDLGALHSGSSRLELRLDLGGGVLLHLVRG
jgi:hypothetical protein